VTEPRNPVADLRRIAFLLERAHEATYRVRAFRTAASVLAGRDDVAQRARAGTLTALRVSVRSLHAASPSPSPGSSQPTCGDWKPPSRPR
jgi:hypothetical protein